MRRVFVLTLAVLLLLPLTASPTFAHGLGVSYDLPLPLWLYLYGAGATVLVSFAPISLLGGGRRAGGEAAYRYPRFDLLSIGPLRAVLTSKALLLVLRLFSVGLFSLVLLSGFFGRQVPASNFAPTFVWVVWWVGFGFFVAFVGNLWPLMNPWKVLFEWTEALVRRLRLGDGLELRETYPAALGVWPAVALYAAFVWLENVFWGSPTPLNIAALALNYSVSRSFSRCFCGVRTNQYAHTSITTSKAMATANFMYSETSSSVITPKAT